MCPQDLLIFHTLKDVVIPRPKMIHRATVLDYIIVRICKEMRFYGIHLGCKIRKHSFLPLDPITFCFSTEKFIVESMTTLLPTERILSAWAQTSFYFKFETVCWNCQHQLKKKNWGYHEDTPSWGNIGFFWSFCTKMHDEQMLDTLPHPQHHR